MIKKISDSVASKIVFETGHEEEKEVYAYGLQIIFNTLISIIMVMLVGICLHEVSGTIAFLISYCSIRLYAGGFHANTNEKCMAIFVFGYLIISFILSHVKVILNLYSILILALINIAIIMWAPVEAYNNPIPVSHKNGMKLKAFFISLTITFVIFLALYFNFNAGAWGYAGMCWFGCVFLTGKIKNEFIRRK